MDAAQYSSSSAIKGVVIASIFSLLLKILFISPGLLDLPPPSPSPYAPWNNQLQKLTKLGDGFLKQPEDVCVDEEGTLYTATRDGWTHRMRRGGSWENWQLVGGHAVIGVAMSSTGDLLACDADKGLLKINDDGVTVLTSEVNGSKIGLADEVIEASDGNIYFSEASTKYGVHNWYLDVVEGIPYGRLLKYDSNTNETSIVLDNLAFPNGVALSRDQDFLVVCETWRFRCLKHWLKGDRKGKTEIFIDNLPGGPDNVNIAPDGSFWIALLELRANGQEFVRRNNLAKYLVMTFSKLRDIAMKGLYTKAMIVNVDVNGKIIRKFDDAEGKVMAFPTCALEFEGNIYLGSMYMDFMGKVDLNQVST